MTSLRHALDVDVSDLFDETPRQGRGQNQDPSFVRRASQRPRLDVGYINKELLSSGSAHNLQFMILHIPPHGSSGPKPMSYPAEKGGMIMSGELILCVGEDEALLAEGDSFMFDSSVPHSFRNPTGEETRVMWIIGAVPMAGHL
jgi:mannose-6-phosphate isomerase-like protein (cupin superfamily)